jgi:hypothetical protein
MKVSWDYEIPNIWKVIRVMFQTTNQIITYNHHELVRYIYHDS